MGRKMTVINKEEVTRAEEALKVTKEGRESFRLRAIIASFKHSVKEVCKTYAVSRATMHRWMTRFKSKGVAALKNASKPSRSKFSPAQKAVLQEWIEANPCETLKSLVLRCKEEWGLSISLSAMHRNLQLLGFANITGRKMHHKASKEDQEKFKKNSKSRWQPHRKKSSFLMNQASALTLSEAMAGFAKVRAPLSLTRWGLSLSISILQRATSDLTSRYFFLR